MMPSVMKHDFSRIPRAEIPRSVFDRSHGYKTTFDASYLVPCFVEEVLPGDTHTLRGKFFARLATPIVPIMDNVYFETFYFFVPSRLVWDNFKRMMGERDNPDDSTDYLIPTITAPAGGFVEGSIYDYMGIPTKVAGLEINALPLRAVNLIWNEWFRDQNVMDSLPVERGDGPDNPADYGLYKRSKRHDYFTSALPWPQKGPGVELPLGTSAPVWGNGKSLGVSWYASPALGPAGLTASPTDRAVFADLNAYDQTLGTTVTPSATKPSSIKPIGVVTKDAIGGGTLESGLYADLSEATAATINSIRTAFQLQKLYERDARGGTRYTEIIRSHFGTISPDARLQRPEYLGGSSSRVMINPVQQTSSSQSPTDTPQGNLAAFGLVADGSGGFHKSFTEHGYIIGFCNVRADLTYQQGLNRLWSRQSRFDFYWPTLAHLGEQEIYNREIYAQGNSEDGEIFGYQERFAEYRYKPSLVTGRFRSNSDVPLDVWHLSQSFASKPNLSQDFIEDSAWDTIDRVIAVPSEPQFLLDAYFDLKSARAMPVYSVPGLVDHF